MKTKQLKRSTREFHCEILGIDSQATEFEVNNAYARRANLLNESYEYLRLHKRAKRKPIKRAAKAKRRTPLRFGPLSAIVLLISLPLLFNQLDRPSEAEVLSPPAQVKPSASQMRYVRNTLCANPKIQEGMDEILKTPSLAITGTESAKRVAAALTEFCNLAP